jgi:hypothetical protein
MHKPSLTTLVHKRLFPNPRANDPTSFAAHISRNLVPEVRIETATFYGALDCIEAQYPGLDYSYPPHRMRLSRFPWHRRLFRAFDDLGLTETEIASLCHWEGTKWARERYEKDNAVKVRDTTGDDIVVMPHPGRPTAILHAAYTSSSVTPRNATAEIPLTTTSGKDNIKGEDFSEEGEVVEEEHDDGESEGELESVGLELNQRLFAATQSVSDGQPGGMDPEFEQWLKEAAERGSFDTIAGRSYPMSSNPSILATMPTIDPIDIVAAYATPQSSHSSSSTTRPEPHPPPPTLTLPAESILEAEASHRQTETAM